MRWSRLGDVAWTLGFHNLADLLYTQGFKQAEREFDDVAFTPLPMGLMTCRNPECLWEAKVSYHDQRDPEIMRQVNHAYATHPCPITEEMLIDWEEDEDDE